MTDLTAQESHFAFGENWKSFTDLVNSDRVAVSDAGIARLFPDGQLAGKRAIDIGCGSGLPALSMLRLGAAHVTCVDIDPASVEATTKTLTALAPANKWTAAASSVFDLDGEFDVVYSWGVLHHTGAMWRAIDKAASLVAPKGLFAIAIYCKTPLCGFWRGEKRFYSRAPKPIQFLAKLLFLAYRIVLNILLRQKPLGFTKGVGVRGMDWWHDQHDWLGGYPYESATPTEIRAHMEGLGFSLEREILQPGNRRGLVGSGCDEYVFRRKT